MISLIVTKNNLTSLFLSLHDNPISVVMKEIISKSLIRRYGARFTYFPFLPIPFPHGLLASYKII